MCICLLHGSIDLTVYIGLPCSTATHPLHSAQHNYAHPSRREYARATYVHPLTPPRGLQVRKGHVHVMITRFYESNSKK